MNESFARSSTEAQRHFSLSPGALDGKVIAISGATGGLGTTLSRECARAGATVILMGHREKKLDKLYDVLVDMGPATPAIVPLALDTAGEAAYAELARLLEHDIGGLDMLVHTAVKSGPITPMSGISQQDWARVMHTNVDSARLLSVACLPLLRRSSIGSVTFLLDQRESAYWGAYGVSKAALLALMRILADENDAPGEDGMPRIAINGYFPGPMRTPLRRSQFPGELPEESPLPDDKLGPLLWLLSRQQRQLTGIALHHAQ